MPHFSAHIVQILLPIHDNQGRSLPHALYGEVRRELTERFGGVTAYTRAPAEGVWIAADDSVTNDDVVVVEVVTDTLDPTWWKAYRLALERKFEQDEVLLRAWPVHRL